MLNRKDSSSIHFFMVHFPGLLCEFYGECNQKAGIVLRPKESLYHFFLAEALLYRRDGKPHKQLPQNYGLEGSFLYWGHAQLGRCYVTF